MILEVLISTILWIGIDRDTLAELRVSCAKVELYYGGKFKSEKIPITFYLREKNRIWKYTEAMTVTPVGAILLEPKEFWIEEIRQRNKLLITINDINYLFDLSGTKKAINCNGDVVE